MYSRRLQLISVLIVLTVFYAILISLDASVAHTVMLGYCALVLTAFVMERRDRRNHD
jgi:hypothetical protein